MSIFKRWINKKAESSILRFFVYNVFNRLVILHENQLFSRHQQYLNYFLNTTLPYFVFVFIDTAIFNHSCGFYIITFVP